MAVLALLAEEPMHVYRMQQLIRERAKDTVINVASRNSVHQVVGRLEADNLISATTTGQEPRRTTYALTEHGAQALGAWLNDLLARPRQEFPRFPAALAFVALMSPQQVASRLRDRIIVLREQLSKDEPHEIAQALNLPRVFLLEDEYKWALANAELIWLQAVVADLETGELTWPAGRPSIFD